MPRQLDRENGSEFPSTLRTAIAALLLTTALSAPAFAGPVNVSVGGSGVSVSVGGTSVGTGSVGGGVGGAVGGITGGGIGGSVLGGGVSIGSGLGGSVGSFSGSNFFSGAANFGNRSTGFLSGGAQAYGQRVTRRANRAINTRAPVVAKSVKSTGKAVAARTGQASLRAQAAAKRIAPVLASGPRTVTVGGQNGVRATVDPDPMARVTVGNDAAPIANVQTQTGDGSTTPLVSTNASVLNQAGATTGDTQQSAQRGRHQHRQ